MFVPETCFQPVSDSRLDATEQRAGAEFNTEQHA